MTQVERILKYMTDFGEITAIDAMREFGCMRLAARISDIEDMGIEIRHEWKTSTNRYGEPIRFMSYRLGGDEHGRAENVQ